MIIYVLVLVADCWIAKFNPIFGVSSFTARRMSSGEFARKIFGQLMRTSVTAKMKVIAYPSRVSAYVRASRMILMLR